MQEKWARSNGSASIATTLGIVFSAITAFSIFTHYFPNSSTQTYSQGSIARDPSVIIIDEPMRGVGLPSCCGFGRGAGDTTARSEGESAYRKKDFRTAIQKFEEALEMTPDDIRSSLGLGKSFIAVKQFEDAIDPLCKVRNDCAERRKELRDGVEETFSSPKFMFLTFDMLPKQACDALDFEAREALQQALLAKTPRPTKLTMWSEPFRKSEHFLIHRAALIEGRKAHADLNATRLQAMFQLASENTRTLQLDVQMENTLKDTNGDRWHQLGELTLNSLTLEESRFYRELLRRVGSQGGAAQLKAAASSYMIEILDSQDEPTTSYYAYTTAPMDKLKAEHEKYYGVCSYHNGLQKLRDSYEIKEANVDLLNALESFKKSGSKQEIADTEYALGIMQFRLDNFDAASEYFQSASKNYRAAGIDSWDADFNCAVLATEYDTRLFDEKMLQELVAKYNNKQSKVLLGLFEVKRKNYAAAEAPLHDAVKAYIQERVSPPVTHTSEVEGNLTTLHHVDRTYTDAELIDAMFKREPRIGECLSTRYATDWRQEKPEKDQDWKECRHRTTTDHYQDFCTVSMNLYEYVLGKLNHKKELDQYLQERKRLQYYKTAINKPICDEERYKKEISFEFASAWFPAGHVDAQNAVVRVRIDKDGKPRVTQFERGTADPRVWKSIADEAIEWVSLPPPPASLVNKEMILVFNAYAPRKDQFMHSYSGRMPLPAMTNQW